MSSVVLKQLVYSSRATKPISSLMGSGFLQTVRAKNASAELTGVLVWREQKFMQVLEGPADSVNRLFSTLLKDDRHQDIVLISERIIRDREFPNWSMQPFDLAQVNFNDNFRTTSFNQRGSRLLDAFRRGVW